MSLKQNPISKHMSKCALFTMAILSYTNEYFLIIISAIYSANTK